MGKILTITVPAYNVERYIQKALDSLVAPEIMDNLEVIVVDDGSKDATARIAAEYQEKYPQTFRVVSKENGGHGSAINRGIELASGRYFRVVDGDDWVGTDALIKLVQRLKTIQTDAVLCNVYRVNNRTGTRQSVNMAGKWQYDHPYQFSEVFESLNLGLGSTAIRTEILKRNQIRLDEHCFYVDMEYVLYPVPYINTVLFLDLFFYMYRIATSTQSTSMAVMRKNLDQHNKVLVRLENFLNQYLDSDCVNREKAVFMTRRLLKMYLAQIHIFLSYSLGSFPIRKSLIGLEESTKRDCNVLYQAAEKQKQIMLLRKTNYYSYPLLHFLLTIYKWRKGRN